MNKNDRHGRLVAMKFVGKDKNSHSLWEFLCDCGVTKIILKAHVESGNTSSCGCLKREQSQKRMTKHSHATRESKTRTYRIWIAMNSRCRNPNMEGYERYGGAGINVCDRWMSFENFLSDMGECPPGLSIDRIDNEKGYEPGNCRWATRQQQNENRRSVRWYEFNGERLNVTQWAKKLGIDKTSMYERLEKWPLERALTEPNLSKKS